MKLKLSQLRIDGGTQSRVKIDQKTVGEYAQLLMDGAVFPPVEAFFDGIDYYLVDGFHRYFSHKAAVTSEISVIVHNGTQREAQLFSKGVNSDHGLKRSVEDKVKAVISMFDDEEWSGYSDRKIAEICKVANSFVSKLRKESGDENKERKYIKNGEVKTMDTTNIGKSKPAKAKEPEPEEEVEKEYDKFHELELVNKDLADEIEQLNDKLAVAAMGGDEEDKNLAQETITELRAKIHSLEQENDVLKSQLATKMQQNADMVKQLNYYRKRVDKLEEKAA